MSLRIDIDRRQIRGGIRDLVPTPQRRRARASFGVAAKLGNEQHRTIAARRRRELGDAYASEVAVQLRLLVDGFDAVFAGRIDGLWRTTRGAVVEEVKMLWEPREVLAGWTARDRPDLWQQLWLYLLTQPDQTRGLLTLVSAWEPQPVVHEEMMTASLRERVIDGVHALLRREIALARAHVRRSRLRRGWAGRLRFGHDVPRAGQEILSDAVTDAVARGRSLLVQAPTGMGKTDALLLGAARAAFAEGRAVWMLTSRRAQRPGVERATDRLACSVPLRGITLRARDGFCSRAPDGCDEDCEGAARQVLATCEVAELFAEGGNGPDAVEVVARSHDVCPYRLSLVAAQHADVVVADFNHVYGAAGCIDRVEPRPVVIIDEAHSLIQRARDAASQHVTLAALRRAADELLTSSPLVDESGALGAYREVLDDYRGLLSRVADEVVTDAEPIDGCVEIDPDGEAWSAMAAGVARALEADAQRVLTDADDSRAMWHELAALAESMVAWSDAPVEHDVPFVDVSREGAGFGMVCVDAGPHLAPIHATLPPVVAASATLAPVALTARQLGIEGSHHLVLPSPFSEESLRVRVDPSIRTALRYRRAQTPRIARLIECLAGEVGRLVCFFPSYELLGRVQAEIDGLTVLTPRAFDGVEIEALTQASPPFALLTVLGGPLAEGVDLPGTFAGAAIIGPGLPPVSFATHREGRYWEDRGEDGFHCAMRVPGMRRVVQAAGRVVRRPEDVGTIVLVGRRFAQPAWLELLPEHWCGRRPEELFASRRRRR